MKIDSTVTELLRYRFTPEEHLQNCEDLAAKLDSMTEMEVEHKAVKANLKEREDRVAAEIGKFTRLVRDKFEMRETRCRWSMNEPAVGQKTLSRIDSGDAVRTVAMLDHERQESLALVASDGAWVLSGPGSMANKKVTDLEDSDIEYYASRDEADLLKFGWIAEDISAVLDEAKRRKSSYHAPIVVQWPTPAETAILCDGPEVPAELTDPSFPPAAPACDHCNAGIELVAGGIFHANSEPCAVVAAQRSAAFEEPVEAAHTLPSARAMAGGSTDEAKKQRRARTPRPVAEEPAPAHTIQDDGEPF